MFNIRSFKNDTLTKNSKAAFFFGTQFLHHIYFSLVHTQGIKPLDGFNITYIKYLKKKEKVQVQRV